MANTHMVDLRQDQWNQGAGGQMAHSVPFLTTKMFFKWETIQEDGILIKKIAWVGSHNPHFQ